MGDEPLAPRLQTLDKKSRTDSALYAFEDLDGALMVALAPIPDCPLGEGIGESRVKPAVRHRSRVGSIVKIDKFYHVSNSQTLRVHYGLRTVYAACPFTPPTAPT